jgi:hypothetical protein
MATALRSSQPGTRMPDRELTRVFHREIAPHIEALEAERKQGGARFMTTAVAFACAIMIMLGVLWPIDPGWAAVATVFALAIGIGVLGSQQRKFRHRVRATW